MLQTAFYSIAADDFSKNNEQFLLLPQKTFENIVSKEESAYKVLKISKFCHTLFNNFPDTDGI